MKLAYIVTERGCLDPTTGANQHIRMGMRELAKHAELIPFLPAVPNSTASEAPKVANKPAWFRRLSTSGVWGAARDLRDFGRNSVNGWKLAKVIKSAGCEAAYVRVEAMQPISLFLRWRKIKVFLEANGLQHISRKSRFRSWLSWSYRPFEKYIYRKADHIFFVGSYGQYWHLDSDYWTEVENGVEPEMFQTRKAIVGAQRPIKLVLLARLVAHHNGILISKAIRKLEPAIRSQIEVHLVGSGFEKLKEELLPLCQIKDHGFVDRNNIGSLLQQMDIGLIPDGPAYASQMKLLDYAANGCLVLAPDLLHLKNFYSGKGVLFFSQKDSTSLAKKIELLVDGDISADRMARELQQHICGTYTWDSIFARKWKTIEETTCR
jgi:glycosyltransferase involved in cell wall biosynthesis